MLIEVLQALSICALVGAVAHIASVVLRNLRAQQFFKIHSPNLPVLPKPSPFSGHAFEFVYGGRNWINIEKYHKQFGNVGGGYIVDKPVIATGDLDFLKRIIIDQPDKHPNRVTLNILSDEIEIDCLATAKDDQWRRLRKAFAPAFSSHKIKSANVQAEIQLVIDKFVASLERRLDKRTGDGKAIEINADDLFHRYALALVYTCFYKQDNLVDFDAERDANVVEVDSFVRALSNPLLSLSVVFPILRPISRWLANNFHTVGRLRAKLISFIKQQTKLHQQAEQTIDAANAAGALIDKDNMLLAGGEKFKRNMVDYVIDQYRAGKMSAREYLHSTYFLFFAANKTTADALSKIIYLLASHLDVQEKLRKLIVSEGADCEYLNWVLYEAMRVYPPLMIGCTRTLSSDEYTSAGHLIPGGTLVYPPPYSIHRLKEYWGDDAEEFRPERWANAKNFHPCQFVAFGAGRRNCLGKEFAMAEMRMLLAQLLAKFKFDKSPKSDGYLSFQAPILILIAPDKPTYVTISRLSDS